MNTTIDNPTVEVTTQPATSSSAIVESADLTRALKLVKGAVSKKFTLPILSNVLLASSDLTPDVMSIQATNLELSIKVRIPMLGDGLAITVPHALLSSTIPAKGDLLLTLDRRITTLNTEQAKTRTNYKGITAEEFPTIPDAATGDLLCVLPLALIKRVIREIAFCASTDESRPQLAGVYMEVAEDGALTFAAADGFRLGRLTGFVSPGSATPKAGKYILPASCVEELDVLDSEHISIYRLEQYNKIAFVGHDVEVSMRPVDGTYVDINRVIPVDFCIGFTAQADDLIAMCKSLKPFAKESAIAGAGWVMRLAYSYGKLTGSAGAAAVGDREVSTGVKSLCFELQEGCEDVTGQIALNLVFVNDIVSLFKGTDIVCKWKTFQSPITIQPSNDLLFVIMPCYLPNR